MQFREKVKYCRGRSDEECFARKESCGQAEFLREAYEGPECTNKEGKLVGKVFLIETDDSDKCAVKGVGSGNLIEDRIPADFKLDRQSDDDSWEIAHSCSAFGDTPLSMWAKVFKLWGSIGLSLLKPVWKQFQKSENCCQLSAAGFETFLRLGAAILPVIIFVLSGCDQYLAAYGLEVFDIVVTLGVLYWRSKPFGCWMNLQTFLVSPCSVVFNIWGLIDGRVCNIFAFQIVNLVLSFCAFAAHVYQWNHLRRGSGLEETELQSDHGFVESSLGYGQSQRYSTGGQPIARI